MGQDTTWKLDGLGEHDCYDDMPSSRCDSIFLTMNKLVSRNLSTQFARQLSSLRENLLEGVPVMHLTMMRKWLCEGHCRTYLSQQREVKMWMEECSFAWACSFSRKAASSFWKKLSRAPKEMTRNAHLRCLVKLVHLKVEDIM